MSSDNYEEEPGEITRILVENGTLKKDRFEYAERVRSKLSSPKPMLDVLKQLGYVTDDQIRSAVRDNANSIKLGQLLVELGLLTPRELTAALALQKESSEPKRLGDVLLENNFVDESHLLGVLADQLGLPVVVPDFSSIEQSLLSKVTPIQCRQYGFIPLGHEENAVRIAFTDPLNIEAQDFARSIFQSEIKAAVASTFTMRAAIKAFENSMHRVQVGDRADESTVPGLVNTMIVDALQASASDIHIEPMSSHLRVRLRCDGVLMHYKDYDLDLAVGIASRLKVLARSNIAEKRRHQGGSFVFEDPDTGHSTDIRASFYVTMHGEKIVLRLLSRMTNLLDIRELGMAPHILNRFIEDALDIPSGVVMMTGPTGSGKTTTLYGCVNYLNDIERSVITAEDPVEYMIDGIGQCSINTKIDMTFNESLRHMMRQDPDVIVLGEIRDNQSADAAVHAALTGHKVLTTFHTEDSIGGLLRLMNMDIETFLISSTVVSVLAQRLLRRICKHCAEPYIPTALDLRRLGYERKVIKEANFLHGKGCNHCRYTGYSGRIGIHELLVLNAAIKDSILEKQSSSVIRGVSMDAAGLVTLLEDGIVKAAAGITTLAEVLRFLPRIEKPRSLNKIRRLVGAEYE